jgi:hypothetical protein
MRFVGCDPIRSLEFTFALSCNGKVWDLHNDGEFQLFLYDCKERALVFHWKYFENDDSTTLLRLEFVDVRSFAVKARDPEMPFLEDDCLSAIVFDGKLDRFLITFMGGQAIRVYCSELKLTAQDWPYDE